jgi:hypothetical protein
MYIRTDSPLQGTEKFRGCPPKSEKSPPLPSSASLVQLYAYIYFKLGISMSCEEGRVVTGKSHKNLSAVLGATTTTKGHFRMLHQVRQCTNPTSPPSTNTSIRARITSPSHRIEDQ